MEVFEGSVAVITGGASGLGYALAREAQQRGCKLVIGDIRSDVLADAEKTLSENGEVLACEVDVSKGEDVEALANAAVERFGKVNLLFNNAGVFAAGVTWETSVEQYEWALGVNQYSVIHGIRSFVPRMIAQGDDCYVITMSSGAGITVNPGYCMYSMTKHAVLALTEALYIDLATQGIENIGVTIAMPGMTQSNIMSPEKTVSGGLLEEISTRKSNAVLNAMESFMAAGVAEGLSAEALASQVFDAIAQRELYVLPGFDDKQSKAIASSIGLGRATAKNPYPPILEGFSAMFNQ